jgi:shikimate kinase
MIVLVIGPSGVGKSTLVGLVKVLFTDFEFCHLDDEAADYAHRNGLISHPDVQMIVAFGWERFLEIGKESLNELAASTSRHLVVDVGAGFLQTNAFIPLLQQFPSICISGSKEAAHQRCSLRKNERRDFAEYCSIEFSKSRLTMYGLCHHTIDTTHLTEEQSAEKLSRILHSLTPK